MALSEAAASLCTAPSHFNDAFRIVNLVPCNCFNQTTDSIGNYTCDSSGCLNMGCNEYWFTRAPNITAILPSTVEKGLDIWVYKSEADLADSLPVSKPLVIDSSMPLCAFGISGPYSALKRYLVYVNMVLAVAAAAAPIFARHRPDLPVDNGPILDDSPLDHVQSGKKSTS